jgi:hypothetical protein
MKILHDYIHSFNFIRMKPDNSVIQGGVPLGGTARALVEPDRAMAVSIRNAGSTGPWSARWTGFIEAPATGEYAFHTFSNDGIRLWVDGRLLIDDWTDHSEKEDTGRISMTGGQRHALKLEYFYNGGQGATKLWWTTPDGKKSAVPANALRLPDGGWGLRGEYFKDRDLLLPWATRDDGTINFAWGVKPPLSGRPNKGETALEIELPAGRWKAEWIDTKSGQITAVPTMEGGAIRKFVAPTYDADIALRLRRE